MASSVQHTAPNSRSVSVAVGGEMRAGMWFFTAFISLFYLIGLGMLGYGLWMMKRSLEVATWPITEGRIESCELKSNSDSDGDTTYEVQVNYTYRVSGQEYQNDRLAFGYSASSGEQAHREILTRLTNASVVRVHYDPVNPQTSVLSYGVHRSIQFILAFATTWLLFVVGFTVIWWLASRSDEVLLKHLVTE